MLPKLTAAQQDEICAAVVRDWTEGRAGDYVIGRFLTPAQRIGAYRSLFQAEPPVIPGQGTRLDFLAGREHPAVLVRALSEGAIPAAAMTDRFAGYVLARADFLPVHVPVIEAVAAFRGDLWTCSGDREYSRGVELYLRALYGETPAQAVPELVQRIGGLDEHLNAAGCTIRLGQLVDTVLRRHTASAVPVPGFSGREGRRFL